MSKNIGPSSELGIIGLNIRKARVKENISRAQLAYEIGTTEKQLSRIENGEINSGILSFIKIARALNIPIGELFKRIKI